MIRYTVSLLTEHTEHPLLAGLFLISAIFLLVGGIAETVVVNETVAGFMGVYAAMAAFMGLLGYALIALARALSKLYRQFDLA